MFFGSLAFVFEVMIYVGLGLPLVHLLVSVIGAAGDSGPDVDVDTDLSLDGGLDTGADLDTPDLDAGEFDFEAGDADLGVGSAPSAAPPGNGFLLRFNLYCLCLAFVVMGAIGIFSIETLTGAAQVVMLVVGAVLALAAYVLLYRFVIWPLKRNKANALKQNDLRFRHARVTFRITQDGAGTIETRDAVGAVISYRAQIDTDICKLERIEEGEEVIVSDIDRAQNLCYVVPAQHKILKQK